MEESQIVSDEIGRETKEEASDSQNELSQPTSLESDDASANHSSFDSQLTNLVQSLLAEIYELRQDFETKVQYDQSKEHLIESLHRELQIHRDGLHFRVLRPIFMDLITMYDDLGMLIERISPETLAASNQLVNNIILFQEMLEEILRRNGAEAFSVKEEVFLPSKQRSLKVVLTSDPQQDKYIARRVRKGFEYEGRLLRHEIVETYKFVPSDKEMF